MSHFGLVHIVVFCCKLDVGVLWKIQACINNSNKHARKYERLPVISGFFLTRLPPLCCWPGPGSSKQGILANQLGGWGQRHPLCIFAPKTGDKSIKPWGQFQRAGKQTEANRPVCVGGEGRATTWGGGNPKKSNTLKTATAIMMETTTDFLAEGRSAD